MPAESIVLNRWTFESDVVLPALLICAVYGIGLLRRRAFINALQICRHISFVTGLAVVTVSLESPLDGLADHLFWAHQIQHLLLRIVWPMLITLSMPQALLISGFSIQLMTSRGGSSVSIRSPMRPQVGS